MLNSQLLIDPKRNRRFRCLRVGEKIENWSVKSSSSLERKEPADDLLVAVELEDLLA